MQKKLHYVLIHWYKTDHITVILVMATKGPNPLEMIGSMALHKLKLWNIKSISTGQVMKLTERELNKVSILQDDHV